MKRAHSVTLLRNLADSIQHYTAKAQVNRLNTLHKTSSTINLTRDNQKEIGLNREQKDNRIFIIEKQIAFL